MKPTRSKDLIKKTADELNMPLELVSDVVDFYYSVVIKKIESLKEPTIFLHGLGTLRISRKKLQSSIKSLEKILDSNDQEDFKKIIKYNFSKSMLDERKQSLEICNNYYKVIYEKRYKNMEKQRSDIGRDKE